MKRTALCTCSTPSPPFRPTRSPHYTTPTTVRLERNPALQEINIGRPLLYVHTYIPSRVFLDPADPLQPRPLLYYSTSSKLFRHNLIFQGTSYVVRPLDSFQWRAGERASTSNRERLIEMQTEVRVRAQEATTLCADLRRRLQVTLLHCLLAVV